MSEMLSKTLFSPLARLDNRRQCFLLDCAGSSLHRPLQLTGEVKRCLNLGSYNYLGFAAADDFCTPRVLDSLRDLGWSSCGSRGVAGAPAVPAHRTSSHRSLPLLAQSRSKLHTDNRATKAEETVIESHGAVAESKVTHLCSPTIFGQSAGIEHVPTAHQRAGLQAHRRA